MIQIDTSKPVLVTGATGYIAGWIVKRLLDEGVTVHAAVRDPENKKKVGHLEALAEKLPGKLRLFKADLLAEGSYQAAMEGCEVVFHTASPFTSKVKDPQKDLVDPAVLGTRNVLTAAANSPQVKRVVVTSSVAAIYGDSQDLQLSKSGKFSEEDWNTTSSLAHQPYSYSKVMAEREAWKIAEAQSHFRLVTVNPALVIGPGLGDTSNSESFAIVRQLIDGTGAVGAPGLNLGFVDVRDVAEMHLLAGFHPEARGRYLCSGGDSSILALAQSIRRNFPKLPTPKSVLPKWLIWLVGPIMNKLVTREFVSKNIGYPWHADNTKGIRELGMTYRPLDESTKDMVAQMITTRP